MLIHGAGGIGQTGWGDFPVNEEECYFDNVLLHNEEIVKTKGFCTDLFFHAGLAWMKDRIDAKEPYFAYISPQCSPRSDDCTGKIQKKILGRWIQ